MPIVKLDIKDTAKRTYDIHIGCGLLPSLGDKINKLYGSKPPSKIFVITDENVAQAWLKPCLKVLPAHITHPIILPAGEATKSFSQLEALLGMLLEAHIDRSSLLIALGGGVIGDLTGFAASIILRGIDFIQIPTSLLAQVDSSVGGKTGINHKIGKNLIGSFKQPAMVLADMDILGTLPKRQLKAGYAEIVKYGVINDLPFFEWLEQNGEKLLNLDKDALEYAVLKSCEAKAHIVAQDEHEQGKRALLNLGHSFGHALEAAVNFDDRLLHGEAVAVGMGLALTLSSQLGYCNPAAGERLKAHFDALNIIALPAQIQNTLLDPKALSDAMAHDKKVKAGRITLVLARDIGQAFLDNQTNFQSLTEFWADQLKF
ncbi:MAG: 3-dehydroquinate synthase [Alphaproteobacteria bacterium]